MSPTDELTMVLVTRQDLQLSKGKLAAQCAHASAECVLSAKRTVVGIGPGSRDEIDKITGQLSLVG